MMTERKFIELPAFLDALCSEEEPGRLLTIWDQGAGGSVQWPNGRYTLQTLISVAEALRLSARYGEAKALADMILSRALKQHDEELISASQSILGRISMHQGNMRQAEIAFTDSLTSTRRSRDHEGTCRSLLWLSYIHQAKGHLNVALEHTLEALQLATEQDLESWQNHARQYSGLHYTLLGKLHQAIDVLSEGVAPTERTAVDYLVSARRKLSLAYAKTLREKYREAQLGLSEARDVIRSCNSVRDLAICYEYEAALYLRMGRLEEAEKAIRECLRISLEEFPDGDMTSQGYRIWAEIDIKRGKYTEAMEHAMSALGVARRVGERIEIGAIERIFGQCAAERADRDAAQKHFTEAIAILSDCGARYELAQSYLAAGRCTILERKVQLSFLHTALSLFQEMEVEGLAQEAEDAIRNLTSPSRRHDPGDSAGLTVLTRSRALRNVLAGIDRVKDLDDIILLEGETGVGKDLLAKHAHYTGNRADRPFVLFNAAAVPEALAESELFGHSRGAFSGAVREREGLLFAAKNGTFFFNEISEAPPAFQAKLLTVLETRKVRPIGSNTERAVEARLIFATNRNLEEEVARGGFRKDLFYRLASARFVIPPLRERAGDIELLLDMFLRRQGVGSRELDMMRQSPGWTTCSHLRWEGNVRELEMFSRRLALETAHDHEHPCAVFERLVEELKTSNLGVRRPIDEARLTAALKRHGGNKRRAAAELGIPESTLRWKLKSLGLDLDA